MDRYLVAHNIPGLKAYLLFGFGKMICYNDCCTPFISFFYNDIIVISKGFNLILLSF